MENKDLLPALKALAHETRFQMIELLLTNKLCVRALACYLKISEAAASQHLQILRKAGLVKGEKIGYWTHYKVQAEELTKLGKQLMDIPDKKDKLKDLNLELCSKNNKNTSC